MTIFTVMMRFIRVEINWNTNSMMHVVVTRSVTCNNNVCVHY